jgi:hypothetical protein
VHSTSLVRRWRPPPRTAFRSTLVRRLLVPLLVGAPASGCDDSFSPVEASALQFSVFGYLDASADTQWIRVMPIRPLAVTTPGPASATVTLEHLGTGRIIELRDSLFRFTPPNGSVGSEGVFLHNFWTTEPIEPGATYRFLARPGVDEPAEAVVDIPPKYDLEVWLGQPRTTQQNLLRLSGLRHVGLLIAEVRFYDQCGDGAVRVSLPLETTEGDEHLIPIDGFSVFRNCGSPQIEKRELLVVGSGAKWPSGPEFAAGGLSVPDVPSNISNSIGFLGGVLTRLVPYESCVIESREPAQEHCKLRYDESSAWLSGTVRDAACDRGPLTGALVSLRELDADAAGQRKVRPVATTRAGAFQIGALEAGKRYGLSVTRFTFNDPYDQFREHTDTLQFTAGERLTYDVALERFLCRP